MTARLTLICHAPTAATREARFPRDEGVDGAAPADAGALAPLRGRLRVGPERRCRETAGALDAEFAIDEGLRDQDFGRWAGLTLAEVAAREPGAAADWTFDPAAAPHGGESVTALLTRVEAWMAERAAAGGRVAGITHPAVLRAAAVAALGAGPTSFWRIEAPPLTRAALSHDGRRWTLAALSPPPPPAAGFRRFSRAEPARSNP